MALKPTTSGDIDLILFLIREELKSRKFFNILMHAGLDYTPFRPHLDEAILAGLSLDAEENAVLDFYERVMDAHAEQITQKQEAIASEAIRVYEELKAVSRDPDGNRQA